MATTKQLGVDCIINATYQKEIYAMDNYRVSLFTAKSSNLHAEAVKAEDDSVIPLFSDFVGVGNYTLALYLGQRVRLVGEWSKRAKDNSVQFKIRYIIPTLPKGEKGVKDFLLSVKGLGPVMSDRVLKYLAPSYDLRSINAEDIVEKVKGVSITRAKALIAAVEKVSGIEQLTTKLKGCVSSDIISDIWEKYEEKSLEVVENNPYIMVVDKTIGFASADAIGKLMGISATDERRIHACAYFQLRCIKNQCCSIIVPNLELKKKCTKVLKIDEKLVSAHLNKMVKRQDLEVVKPHCYLAEDFQAELDAATTMKQLLSKKVLKADKDRYNEAFGQWQISGSAISLAQEQENAVKTAGGNYISVLTGGPGTGKSTVLKAIIETYNMAFPESTVTLMAPTGLAAKRMYECTGVEARTIHSALGLVPADNECGFLRRDDIRIDGGLVIVDEFSMVGIHLFSELINSIELQRDVRIVLVGDIHQLPSVSPGAVLKDLINSNVVPKTELIKNFRQAAGNTIVNNAYKINSGNTDLIYEGNFSIKEIVDPNKSREALKIIEEIKIEFVSSIQKYGLKQTYVLCPMRKYDKTDQTCLSTTNLNVILRDLINPRDKCLGYIKHGYKEFRIGDRVINTKNCMKAMNGEIGYITDILKDNKLDEVYVDFDGRSEIYTLEELKNLDLAFAITVHKAQGCEFDSVIYPASLTHFVMLKRNLLYTAVTRAKKQFLAIGNKIAINTAVETVDAEEKRDLLEDRLRGNL